MGVLSWMDKDAGDLKLIWDSGKQSEVDAVKDQFEKLKKKGYKAYNVKKDGEPGKEIDDFDPDAEKIIMRPKAQPGCVHAMMPYNP